MKGKRMIKECHAPKECTLEVEENTQEKDTLVVSVYGKLTKKEVVEEEPKKEEELNAEEEPNEEKKPNEEKELKKKGEEEEETTTTTTKNDDASDTNDPVDLTPEELAQKRKESQEKVEEDGGPCTAPFCWSCEHRIRKDFRDLSTEERALWWQAMNDMKSHPIARKTGETTNLYDEFVMIHAHYENKPQAHGT
jgi:hypothetical protein